jgi:hypothetical protein
MGKLLLKAQQPDFRFDVFLMYSARDKEIVQVLAQRLMNDGLRVWYDEWEIPPGHRIELKVEEGLEHSRTLVLCMSMHAFGSEWVHFEDRFRDPLNNERRFILLRLDAAPVNGSLAQFLDINWLPDCEQAYDTLREACRPPTPRSVELQTAREQFAERAIQLDCKDQILAYAFTADRKRAVTGGDDKIVRLWDMETGQCLRAFKGHTDRVSSVAWSADQRLVLSGGGQEDGTLRLWDVESGALPPGNEGASPGDLRHRLSRG